MLPLIRPVRQIRSYPIIPGLHADWLLAADVALVEGRVLSPGSVRYGTSANVDVVLE